MMNSDESWKSCGCETGFIVDHVMGKIRCSKCGCIIGGDSAAPADFFRLTLQNPQNLDSTPSSVGTTSDPNPYEFLPFTFGNQSTGDSFLSSTQLTPPHPVIRAFSERLSLPERVKIRADETLKIIEEKTTRGKNWPDAVYAACIYSACRREVNMPRSISEICSVANGVTPSNMFKAIEFIAEELKMDKTLLMNFETADYIEWFCSALDKNSLALRAALKAAKCSECVNSTRSAISVAAMVVYVIGRFTDKIKSLEDVAQVTGVDVETMKQTYDELYIHLTTITPNCFLYPSDQEEIDRI